MATEKKSDLAMIMAYKKMISELDAKISLLQDQNKNLITLEQLRNLKLAYGEKIQERQNLSEKIKENANKLENLKHSVLVVEKKMIYIWN